MPGFDEQDFIVFFVSKSCSVSSNLNNFSGDKHADWSLWNDHDEMQLYIARRNRQATSAQLL